MDLNWEVSLKCFFKNSAQYDFLPIFERLSQSENHEINLPLGMYHEDLREVFANVQKMLRNVYNSLFYQIYLDV